MRKDFSVYRIIYHPLYYTVQQIKKKVVSVMNLFVCICEVGKGI